MLTSKVAKRYAQGLLIFSQESGNTSVVFSEMKDLLKILNSSKELNHFFNTPIIDSKKKIKIVSEIFSSFSTGAKNLIYLVIKHGREVQLKNIAQEYINKVEDMEGVQRISITSATPLSAENIQQILNSTSLVNHDKKFDVAQNINPALLGGYILRVGDQQVDASVKTKLNHLQKEFQLN